MTDWLASLSPVMQGTLAGVGTWLLTALGSVPVLFVREAPRRLMDLLMGFAAGIMVAASCWSLLVPAMERGGVAPALAGLLAGAAVLYVLDQALPHLHPEFPDEATREGPPLAWRRSTLLIAAITLHNFPEGLAVGVGYGGTGGAAATALAIGIGLQNLPEGLAVALPLRREGMNRWKALWYGQLTAVVEPVAALLGAAVVSQVAAVLPFTMAFAAGAMLYVVVEELIPETVRTGNIDVATIGFIVGFAVMMALDNLLG
ncbi:MAG TPA: ZIP family metal transporter [Gemmatimonadales bacterium]